MKKEIKIMSDAALDIEEAINRIEKDVKKGEEVGQHLEQIKTRVSLIKVGLDDILKVFMEVDNC